MNIGTACCHSPTCADRECEGRPDPETTRRQQEAELRWSCREQMSARQLYEHERAGDFVGDRHAGVVGHGGELPHARKDEPITDPNYMLTLAAVWGIVAVAVIVGGIAWLAHFVWPVLAAYINR